MIFKKVLLLMALGLIAAAWGCSHGAAPTEPPMAANPKPAETATSNPHGLWGLYTFTCDLASATVDIQPLRDAELHLNALHFLEPPPYVNVTLESKPKINGNILDIDIGLRHPFLGQNIYTGFDVCGIMFTHGSVTGYTDPDIIMSGESDTRLLNADGYTRWWNPAEFPHGDTMLSYINGLLGTPVENADFNCTLNAYKYFADGLDKDAPLTALDPANRGVFSAGGKNIRHYKIDMSGGLIFNYAVDACWKMPQGKPPYNVPDDFPPAANRPEAWNVSVMEVENRLNYDDLKGCAGGYLKLQIDVWDHYSASVNKIYCESLDGIPLTSSLVPTGGGEGYSTYEIDLLGENITHSGDADLLIAVQSEVSGYGGILPGETIVSYFKHSFMIKRGWARTWGASDDFDEGRGVAVDGLDNIYVTGIFHGNADFDPGPGIDEHNGYYISTYLSKFDSCGEYEWARIWGPGSEDPPYEPCECYGEAVTADGLDNIYVTGEFYDSVDFDPGPGIEEHKSDGGFDIFLSKFDSTGVFKWACTWGGTYDSQSFCEDTGQGVSVDEFGNVYIIGCFYDTVDFDPGPGVDIHTATNGHDCFLSKFNSNGDFQWVQTWGGHIYNVGPGIAIDHYENIYIIGTFGGVADFDPGSDVEQHKSNGEHDVFISRFDIDGHYKGTLTWGGQGEDFGNGAAVDNSGNVYLTGFYSKTVDFDPGPGIDEHTSNGYGDIFLSKFKTNGSFEWVRTSGGPLGDLSMAVASDNDGNICVAGYFQSIEPYGTCNNSLISKFGPNGDYLWAKMWECSCAWSTVADYCGNIYATGGFGDHTIDFDPSPGTDFHTPNGWLDTFLIKLPPDGNW